LKAKTIGELHTALRAAIEDKFLERERPVRFFFDSEVIVRAIIGFRQLTESANKSTDLSEDSMVVRALLASGFLGRVFLLLPHLVEVDNYVALHNDDSGKQSDLEIEVTAFLQKYQVKEKFDDLLKAVDLERGGADSTERIIDAIRSFDVSSFVAIEMATGTVQHRLLSLRKSGILGFDSYRQSLDLALRDAHVERYSGIIARGIPEERRAGRSKSLFNDALALGMLRRKILASTSEPGEPFVRFYTEADALLKVFKDEEIRDDLAYPDDPGREPILRSAYYFLLRSYFPAIGFPHMQARVSGDPAISLADLKEFCAELEELPEEEKIKHWKSVELKSQRLIEPLRDLESLAFFQGVWLSYALPSGVAAFVDSLRDMAAFFKEGAFSEEIRARIAREMAALRATLSSNAQELRELFELLVLIEPKVIELRRTARDEYEAPPLPTIITDVGFVRWGFLRSAKAEELFKARLDQLIHGEDAIWRIGCREIVGDIREVNVDLDRLTVVCAVLWFLGAFPEIVSFVGSAEKRLAGALPVELHLMRAAARLRAEELSRDEKEHLIADLGTLIDALPDDLRRRYQIGLAYVLAHAANFEIYLFRAEDLDDVQRRWLRQSLEIANEVAEATSQEQSLLRAFAVNHCAYVGTVASDARIANPEITLRRMSELNAIHASQPKFWNFRFVDTVLMPRYLEAKKTLRDLKDATSTLDVENEVRGIQQLVKEALAAYSRAGAYLDREIPVHRRRWEELESEAKDVRRNRARTPVLTGNLAPDVVPPGGGIPY
jgi:hypothetical protein